MFRPLTASNCCYQGALGCSRMFRIFRPKSCLLWCLFSFWGSLSLIIAFVADTQQLRRSALRTNTPCGVRYVACHAQVALLLSFLGLPWCSDWYAVGCSATVAFGCLCSSHVSGWLTLVEVFGVVPLGVSCFLSCGVGGPFVAH